MTDNELKEIEDVLSKFSEVRSVEAQMNELLLGYAKRLLAYTKRLVSEVDRLTKLQGTIQSLGLLGEVEKKPTDNIDRIKLRTNIEKLQKSEKGKTKAEDSPSKPLEKKSCVVLFNPKHEKDAKHIKAQISSAQETLGVFKVERKVFDERVPETETKIVLANDYFFNQNQVMNNIDGGNREVPEKFPPRGNF